MRTGPWRRWAGAGIALALLIGLSTAGSAAAAPARNAAAPISALTWHPPQQVGSRVGRFASVVSCPSRTFCMAADDNAVLRFDGSRWTRSLTYSATTALDMGAISCVSATFCMAAREGGRVYRWDGSRWTVSAPTAIPGLNPRLSCVSATFCLAAGDTDWSVWNGYVWSSAAPLPSGFDVTSLSCATPTFCEGAGGQAGAVVSRFTGSAWVSPTTLSTGFAAADVSCPTRAFCIAVVRIFDATNPTEYFLAGNGVWGPARPGPFVDGDAPFSGLSCSAATFCLAVAGSGHEFGWNGTSWSARPDTPLGQYEALGLSCRGTAWCELVSDDSASTRSGGTWSSPTLLDPDAPNAIASLSCLSASFCAASDTSSGYIHAGSTWSGRAQWVNYVDDSAIGCGAPKLCVGVLSSQTVDLAAVYDGSTWTTSTANLPDITVSAMACPSATRCIAVGYTTWSDPNTGQAWIFDGSSWQRSLIVPPGGVQSSLRTISCTSATFCLATGTNARGAVSFRFDGTSWSTATAVHATQALIGADCQRPTWCLGVTASGQVQTYDGTRWAAPMAIPGLSQVGGVSCRHAAACLAFSSATDQVSQYTGAGWLAPVTVPGLSALTALSCPTAGFCAVADDHGRVATATAP